MAECLPKNQSTELCMQQLSKSRAVHLPQPLPCPHPPHGVPCLALPWHWCSCTCTCCLPPFPHPACTFFLQKLTAAEKRVESAENVWLRGIWMISACLFVKIPQLLGSPTLRCPALLPSLATRQKNARVLCLVCNPAVHQPAYLPSLSTSLSVSASLSHSLALAGILWLPLCRL